MNKNKNVDDIPLYTIAKYRRGLEMINENVPLGIVKKHLQMKEKLEFANKNESKSLKRKQVMIDGEFQERACKTVVIDPRSDTVCKTCIDYPGYHPYGCNN